MERSISGWGIVLRLSLMLVLAVGLAGALFQAARGAATLYAAPGGLTSGTCDSWANACELRYALLGTVAVSGDEIWVERGTYKPTSGTDRSVRFYIRSGVAVYGGFAGGETARDQRNPATNVVLLSGDIGLAGDRYGNSYHVVECADGATLDGVTISDGNADGSTAPQYLGGGMYNDSGSPTLTNVIFSGNYAQSQGGGMYNESGSPTLTNVTFSGNYAQSGAGDGGGVYNYSGSPTLTNVTFSGNSAYRDGGGMYNYYGNPTLINVTFSGNSADGDGGGMHNWFGSPTLTNVTFSSNSAQSSGGGMIGGSSPTLTNVTFSGNSAQYDGGGMVSGGISGTTLTNVTFSGNSAAHRGGGIYDYNSSPTIRNIILWGNTAPTGSQVYDYGISTPTISDSVVQDGYAGGTNIITADPLLGTLGNYGGSAQTIPLLPGSSAIGAASTNCPAADQRGVTRGTTCDIGAFESQGFTLAKSGGDGQATFINTAFAQPLGLTVTASNAVEPVNGGKVTFTAPSSGASTTPMTNTATIAAGGVVSQSVTANGTAGSYNVTASASGATSVNFTLHNLLSIMYAKPGGLTSGSCESWVNACELRYALSIAVSGVEIWVKAGTYRPTSGADRTLSFQLKSGVAIYGGFAGTETARDQRNPATNVVILSGDLNGDDVGFTNNDENSYHVVTGADGATLDGVTILGGNANGSTLYSGGGGMYNDSGSPTLTDVTFSGNYAQYGGGMLDGGSSTLSNVTFSGNSAQYGGGMVTYDSTATLTNVTFSGNSAQSGGGMYNWFGGPTLKNVILWGDTASSTGPEIGNGASTPSISYSVVQGSGGSGGSWHSSLGTDGGGNLDADPLLGSLQDNGGCTRTMALGAGSSAIDAGDDAACPATDQRGVTRPWGVHCDIGAFEFEDTTPPSVVSIQRADVDPTNANSVDFIVAFSESVTGVDTTDFVLAVTGEISGAAVSNVAGSGDTYTVTVDTGTGDGTIRLDLHASATITDLVGKPLANLPYTGGETYVVNRVFKVFLPLAVR